MPNKISREEVRASSLPLLNLVLFNTAYATNLAPRVSGNAELNLAGEVTRVPRLPGDTPEVSQCPHVRLSSYLSGLKPLLTKPPWTKMARGGEAMALATTTTHPRVR